MYSFQGGGCKDGDEIMGDGPNNRRRAARYLGVSSCHLGSERQGGLQSDHDWGEAE